MSDIPSSVQVMTVDGEIQIKSTAGYRELAGRVAFTGPFDTRYGQMRVFGSSGQYYHLMDCTGCSEGFCIRTLTNQGSTVIGGVNEPYSFQVKGLNTTARNLSVFQPLTTAPVLNGNAVFAASRYSTENSSSLTNAVANFYQQNWRAEETLNVTIGMSPFTAYGYMGYKSPTASYSDTSNQVIIGHNFQGTNTNSILISNNGNVNIPARLDVDTISATTYLNIPFPDLTPITLDKVNGRVGINRTLPDAALHVVGNTIMDGDLSQITGTTSLGALTVPSAVCNGKLTVDGLIDQTSGTAFLGALTTPSISCSGNLNAGTTSIDGQFQVVSTSPVANIGFTVNPLTQTTETIHLVAEDISCTGTVSGTLTTASQPNITSVGTLTSVTTSGNISQTAGTSSLGDLTVPSISCSGNVSGTLTTAAQPNITSVGTLTSVTTSGNISQTAGTSSLGALTVPSISCSGNVSGTLTTASQPNITSVGTLTSVTTSGNISQTAGTSSLGALTVPSISCSGNVSGTLTTAAQPNITSVGTLSALNVTGDVNIDSNTLKVDSTNNRIGINKANPTEALDIVGNIAATGTVSINPSAVGTKAYLYNAGGAKYGLGISPGQFNYFAHGHHVFYFGGDNDSGTKLLTLSSSGVIQQHIGNSNLGALTVPSISCSGNMSGTLTTAAQPNITSVGTLTSITTSGNISQTAGTSSLGALTVPSISCSGNVSGTLTTASQPNITSVGTLSTLNVTGDVVVDTDTLKVDSTNNRVGIRTTNPTYDLDVNGECRISQNLFVAYNTGTTNLNVGYQLFSYGNIVQLGGTADLKALTVPSITCSGNISGTLITAAQPNITSVGTLTSITTSGNISQTAGTSSLGALTVPSISCSGNMSGTLTTSSQPNITSVGTLSTLNVTGDVAIDSNTIKVDSTNNRVGICTTNPAYNLEVTGTCNITGNLTVGGTIVNAGLGTTTITKNSSVAYSPAVVSSAVFQSVATITIPANSVCLVDCIVTITKNSSSTTGAAANFRLQSSTTPNTLSNKQNGYLFSTGVGVTITIINAGTALNDSGSGHLIASEVQYNTTSSDVTLYLGWYLTATATAASFYRIDANDLVATVTKVGTI